ncbi:MAG TPA: hypothetical protein VKC58_01710 [Myxococcales bacterium]|nr:hypothetical protein [Myxococcales bacterium]
MRMNAAIAASAIASLAACRTAPARQDLPAVVAQPTSQSHAEMVRAVSAALNGVAVTLADDALTRESTLVLERAKRRDPSGLPVQGRELGMPERFRLVKSGTACVLIHEGSGQRFTLRDTTCSPVERG